LNPVADCQTGSIEVLAELLGTEENKAVYFNMANRFSGDRPVHTAMRHGFLDVFKALVANGADPTVKNRFGDTVLDYPGDFEPDEVQRVVDEYRERTSRRPD
jgi:ankyrin repeat protein